LSVDRAVDARERHQRQVHGVEHELYAHEHHDRVATHEDADGADREQQRRQQQVVRRGHESSPSLERAPTVPSRLAPSDPTSALGPCFEAPPFTCLRWVCSWAVGVDSIRSDSDSGATEPSGSRAGVATELEVANTPGPGFGDGRSYSPRNRAMTSSRWLRLPPLT